MDEEIILSSFNPWTNFRWWMLKNEVVIDTKMGWTPEDHLGNSAFTADPNWWYRDWLEKHLIHLLQLHLLQFQSNSDLRKKKT